MQLEMSMWPQGRPLVQLTDVLAPIDGGQITWRVLDFEGVVRPTGRNILEFESSVSETPGGVVMSWAELNAFAQELVQTYDALIHGQRWSVDGPADRRGSSYQRNADVTIVAFDSSSWEITLADESIWPATTLDGWCELGFVEAEERTALSDDHEGP